MERVCSSRCDCYCVQRTDNPSLQMRQFYEDLDTLESGLADVAGMQTKTVCLHFPQGTAVASHCAGSQKRQAITNEHIVNDGLKKMQQVATQILVAHKDADG